MTTTPLTPTAPLTPAQQLILVMAVSSALENAGLRLLSEHPELSNQSQAALLDLERLDLLVFHGHGASGQPFATLNREAFTVAFDLYRADMVAQGAGGCL